MYKCVDLFCGAGGMSKGFHDAGFETVYAVESNPVYARTYISNFPNTFVCVSDIKNVSDNDIERIKDESIDIIIGGPPCQGFSIAGNIGRKFLDDDRNRLFLEYVRFVKIIRPKMFVLENVAALVRHNNGKTIKEIIDEFKNIGYEVQYQVLNAVDFLVPQDRKKLC